MVHFGVLATCSQFQFSGLCFQDSGSQGRKSQVPGSQFQCPWCHCPMSQGPSSRVLAIRVLCPGSQGPRDSGFRISGPRVGGPGSLGPSCQSVRVLGLKVSGSWVLGVSVPRPISHFLILDYALVELPQQILSSYADISWRALQLLWLFSEAFRISWLNWQSIFDHF